MGRIYEKFFIFEARFGRGIAVAAIFIIISYLPLV